MTDRNPPETASGRPNTRQPVHDAPRRPAPPARQGFSLLRTMALVIAAFFIYDNFVRDHPYGTPPEEKTKRRVISSQPRTKTPPAIPRLMRGTPVKETRVTGKNPVTRPERPLREKAAACTGKEPAVTSWVVHEEKVTVHRGPGGRYEKTGGLAGGKVIRARSAGRGWLRLDYGQYIPTTVATPMHPGKNAYRKRYVRPNQLNVREVPWKGARATASMSLGETLQVAVVSKQWGRIKGGGYVALEHLSNRPVLPTRFPAMMRVSRKEVRVHQSPGSKTVVGMYFENTTVRVLGIRNQWARIGPGQFVNTKYLVYEPRSSSRVSRINKTVKTTTKTTRL